MNSVIKLIIGLCTIAMLASCGPLYQTKFHYRLPQRRSDRHCVAQCRMGLSTCKNSCRQANQSCENQQLIAQDIADRHHHHDRDFTPTPNCQQNCHCRQAYNACYTDCGGEVIAKKVCVFNCPPQPRR